MSQLSPSPRFQVCDVAGVPLAGGRLYTYAAGTSTPKDTYLDYSVSAANTNPIILDSRGEATIWLNGAYRFVLRDADDVLIWEEDQIRDLTNAPTLTGATLAGTLTVSSTAITWSGNPTHSGNHTFTNNVYFNGNVTLGDSSVDSLTIRPVAVTWSANPTHTANHTFSGNVTIDGNLTAGNLNLPTYGTYTPTFTAVTNLDSDPTVLGTWRWMRVGSIVTCSGAMTFNPTATGQYNFRGTLPVSSAFTDYFDVTGSFSTAQNPGDTSMAVYGSVATSTFSIYGVASGTSPTVGNALFMYEVK